MAKQKIKEHNINIKDGRVFLQSDSRGVFSWDICSGNLSDNSWNKLFDYLCSFDMDAYNVRTNSMIFSIGLGYSFIQLNKKWVTNNINDIISELKDFFNKYLEYDDDFLLDNISSNDDYNNQLIKDGIKRLNQKYYYHHMKKKENKNYNRFKIFQRDNFKCKICGKGSPDVVLHIDHWIPKARGGLDIEENLVTLCSHCNISKNANIPKIPILEILKDSADRNFKELKKNGMVSQ